VSNESLSDIFTRYATEDREQAIWYGSKVDSYIMAAKLLPESSADIFLDLAVGMLHIALMYARTVVKHEETARAAEHIHDEPQLCTRWGQAEDRCLEPYGHIGPCRDASGETTLTLAARILGR
jgi:hypothetical protein